MAFTKQIRTFITLALITSALAACAKKDSEFRARKTKGGAVIMNPEQTGKAREDAAKQHGIDAEIYTIQAPVAGAGGGLTVKSYIKVNNKYYEVTINHTSTTATTPTKQSIDGAEFEVVGRCASEYCHPYYLLVNVSRGGQQVIQMAEKKFFYVEPTSNAQEDLYFANGPGKFLSFPDAEKLLDAGVAPSNTTQPGPAL